MTILLVIATFAAFILLDYVTSRGRTAEEARAIRIPEPEHVPEPVWVAGYQLPEALHYHRGHTWARVLDADTVVVGIDDFARRLLGPARALRLPPVGTWLRQGGKGFGIDVDGRAAELVAPVEGEVVDVDRATLYSKIRRYELKRPGDGPP